MMFGLYASIYLCSYIVVAAGWGKAGFEPVREVSIRNISVGIFALVTVAAAGLLLRRGRREVSGYVARKRRLAADRLYAAGM